MGSATLGYYALGYQINDLPTAVLAGSVYYAIFSTTSEMDRSKTFTSEPFMKSLKGVLLISAPASAGLALTAPLSIPMIVGERWLPSVQIIQLLALMCFCQSIGIATSALLLGRGRSDTTLRLGVIGSLLKIAGITVGVFISPEAVAAGLSIATVISLYITLRAVIAEAGVNWRGLLSLSFAPIGATLPMCIAVYLFQTSILLDASYVARFLASVCVGAGAYSLVLFTVFHNEIASDIMNVRSVLLPRRSGGPAP